MNTDVFYVYILFRPNGIPCYVGKGQRDRSTTHFQPGILKRHSNKHLANIIKKAGGKLPVVIIKDKLSNRLAIDTEIIFIKAIGRKEFGGPLVNLTDGGEGQNNLSKETKEKIGNSNRGRKHSNEVKEYLRKLNIGKKMSPEANAKTKAANLGKKVSIETCLKISRSKTGVKIKPKSEAAKKKMRDNWKDPEIRNRFMKWRIGRRNTPETIEKMRIAAHKRHGSKYIN